MKLKSKNLSQAFSFVEVMIAVFLVSVGLLAALKLLTGGLSATMDSRDQLIASLLAQEGTELVRSIRDTNWVNGEPSFNGGTATTISNGAWRISYNSPKLVSVTTTSGYRLYRSSSNFYAHTATASLSTKFLRRIIVSGDNNQKVISCMVVWNGRTTTNPFTELKNSSVVLTKSTCNTANKCAYAEDALTNWGE